MGCNCKHVELIVGLVVIVFALWGDAITSSMSVTKWVLVISGAALLLHAFKCRNCGPCTHCDMPKKSTTKKKK
jgi:hypothetical protein